MVRYIVQYSILFFERSLKKRSKQILILQAYMENGLWLGVVLSNHNVNW